MTQASSQFHQDWCESCVGTFFETVEYKALSKTFKPDQIHAYPTPKNATMDVVLNPFSWTWRKTDSHQTPFIAAPFFIWEFLLELIVMFQFHFFDADTVVKGGSSHLDQLMAFLESTFVTAKISHGIPTAVWKSALKTTSELLQKFFTANLLLAEKNRQDLVAVLKRMYDRRYHLSTAWIGTFSIKNSSKARPLSILFRHLEDGKLPWAFGKNSNVVWDHGPLLLDVIVTSRMYE